MRMTAPLVVAGWGAANGLLTALLAGMGGSAVPVAIYGSATVLVELIAAATVISRHRRPAGPPWRQPPAGNAVLIAIGAMLAGLGLAFGWWITITSVPVFVAAAVYEAYAIRQRA